MILFGLLAWIVPIAIIVLIVRAFSRRGKIRQGFSYRKFILGATLVAAGYPGVVGLYYLPVNIFGSQADSSIFAAHLIIGVLLLLLGLALKRLTGHFLMTLGVISLFLAAPFVFENLGSVGALLVVFLALAVLVAVTIRLSKKGQSLG